MGVEAVLKGNSWISMHLKQGNPSEQLREVRCKGVSQSPKSQRLLISDTFRYRLSLSWLNP